MVLVLIAGWLAFGARAQEVRYALLIGNEDYPGEIGRLSLPHEDILRMRSALQKAGFPAARLYGIACEAGDSAACFNLALDLKSGNGMPEDQAASRRLLLQACDGGLDRACREIAVP